MIFRKPPVADLAPNTSNPQALPSDHDQAAGLIMRLGRALLGLGLPAHRVETTLGMLAERLGLSMQLLSTPTALILSLGDEQNQHTYLVRVNPGSPNLGKLANITQLINRLAQRKVALADAYQQANDLLKAPPHYNILTTLFAFVMTSSAAAVLIGGGWNEAVLSGLLGGITGITTILAARTQLFSRLLAPFAAALVALCANLFCSWQPDTILLMPIIAGLIVLLPGLDFTAAARELATGHLLSGSARLAGSIVVFITLVFGLALGGGIADMLGISVTGASKTQPLPLWAACSAVVVAGIGLSILFRANPRDWIWVVVVCAVAWLTPKLGQAGVGPYLSACLAAIAVGLSGNLYALLSGRPAMILHTPGLILLVPGSVGFESLTAIMNNNVLSGIESFFHASLIAVALATGLIISSIVMPPRTDL